MFLARVRDVLEAERAQLHEAWMSLYLVNLFKYLYKNYIGSIFTIILCFAP
jgi:hypothetical protein